MSSRKPIGATQARAMGARIREARGSLTQAEFALKLGIDRAAVANYESGRRIPNDAVLKRLSSLAGKSIPELLFGDYKTPFQSYLSGINEEVLRLSRERPGVIPRFMFSDDELALITVARLAALDGNLTGPLRSMVSAAERMLRQEEDMGAPPYGEEHVTRVRAAVDRGYLEEGYDPDAQLFATFSEEDAGA